MHFFILWEYKFFINTPSLDFYITYFLSPCFFVPDSNAFRSRIKSIIDESLLIMRSVATDYNVVFENKVNSFILKSDKSKLKQIFINLFKNSIESMIDGGKLMCESTISNNNLIIIISDTGCGMSEDIQKKVFDSFFTTKETRTGLGLSICKKIIDSLNGKIYLDSEINRGTTFKIEFQL